MISNDHIDRMCEENYEFNEPFLEFTSLSFF